MGAGLLSSYGEIEHAIESPEVQRYPMQLEWAINQSFEIDHYQPLLFVVESFDHLFYLVGRLEQWMKEGRLNHVAPGEPAVEEADLQSFLNAAKIILVGGFFAVRGFGAGAFYDVAKRCASSRTRWVWRSWMDSCGIKGFTDA